ncbi:META domain-containing protein [Blastomonas sp.]|uniref:META domain-containing protein n=1 Tax=Blastomonas sp. TaxID=1909299 RepID=UPI0035936E98
MRFLILPLVMFAAGCAANAPSPQSAGRDGATYVARGQEPGWIVRMDDATIRYEGDYGATVLSSPRPRGAAIANGQRYSARDLVVEITNTPCQDVMSGERFADTVRVTARGTTVSGCGGIAMLPDGLEGTRWSIVSIDGKPVAADRPTEVRFEGGRISGTAGCNRFAAGYTIRDGKLRVAPMAMTRMACIGPGGDQEEAFTALFAGDVTMQLTPDGRMTLTQGEHVSVLQQSP